jgi:hypothetical protein
VRSERHPLPVESWLCIVPQVTVSRAANKIDHYAGLATNGQIDWPTANRAIFDERLLRFRSIDLQRKNFAAVRAGDVDFDS